MKWAAWRSTALINIKTLHVVTIAIELERRGRFRIRIVIPQLLI